MNLRSIAATTLGLSVAAEALRYTPQRNRRVPIVGALWGLHLLAALCLAARSRRIPVPKMARRAGMGLMAAGAAAGAYSAAVEHTSEGRRSGPGDGRPSLRDLAHLTPPMFEALEQPPRDGTYRASRHPALLGYAAFVAGLALVSRSVRLIGSLPLWIAAAAGYAALREETLRRDLDWYDDYAKTTPMLLPTKESARAAYDDLRERFSGSESGAPATPVS